MVFKEIQGMDRGTRRSSGLFADFGAYEEDLVSIRIQRFPIPIGSVDRLLRASGLGARSFLDNVDPTSVAYWQTTFAQKLSRRMYAERRCHVCSVLCKADRYCFLILKRSHIIILSILTTWFCTPSMNTMSGGWQIFTSGRTPITTR